MQFRNSFFAVLLSFGFISVPALVAGQQPSDSSTSAPIDMGGMSMSMPSSISLTDPMNREGSGTAWLPDSTPMFGKMIMQPNGNMLMLHGAAMPRYTDVASKRGDRRFDAPNWFMGMLSHPLTTDSQLGLRSMLSLDPITEGGFGYPLLFQTGETWHHQPLHDRQHPHDLIDELSVTYSKRVGDGRSAYLYLGYPGEPALGPPTYMHRLIAYDLADAPIGHHWQDATHITFGVATGGLELSRRLKIEGSVFTGREPDENRYSFDKPRFDSQSARLSWNPDVRNAYQVSYGSIKNPEGDGADQHRTTASWIYNQPLGIDSNFTTSLVWGQNDATSEGISNSYLEEADYQHGSGTLYARLEQIQKSGDELVLPAPFDTAKKYWVGEYTVGYVHDLSHGKGIDTGVGAAVTVEQKPSSLDMFYGGGTPVSFQVYLRFRPSRSDRAMSATDMSSMSGMSMPTTPMQEEPAHSPSNPPAASPQTPQEAVPMIAMPSQPPVISAPTPSQTSAPNSGEISTPAASSQPAGSPPPVIAIVFTPGPPVAGKSETMTVTITRGAKAVTGAKVTADISMATMDMGTSHPAFKESAGGKYKGAAKFTMAGPWKVVIRAKAGDGSVMEKSMVVQVGM